MQKSLRLEPFEQLHSFLTRFSEKPNESILTSASAENPWFVRNFVLTAIKGITQYLDPINLNSWLANYDFNLREEKNVGIIMAGNIPLAGFHDLLCTLVSGNKAIVKPSHQDSILIEYIIRTLYDIDPSIRNRLIIVDRLTGVDALIASGSDNTARRLQYFYRDIPYLIRANRTSCCILDGSETEKDLSGLSDDIFLYFGFGCRNVSKTFIPVGYNLEILIPALNKYAWIIRHKKYFNNYIHNRGLLDLNHDKYIDGGYFILSENSNIGSPIGIINYQEYKNEVDLLEKISDNRRKIQCVVSGKNHGSLSVDFGKAQFPMPWDYADNSDTLNFLVNL